MISAAAHEQIAADYLSGMNQREMAGANGVHMQTIRAHLRTAGMATRGGGIVL
ncbi:MAG: hypothetical protein LBI84_00195 [Propionibacteriaceae bacterium]|jgi:uncharacterized protein YjcR|nr:hypothetical protein [Propionibacteriaceae bacterium]